MFTVGCEKGKNLDTVPFLVTEHSLIHTRHKERRAHPVTRSKTPRTEHQSNSKKSTPDANTETPTPPSTQVPYPVKPRGTPLILQDPQHHINRQPLLETLSNPMATARPCPLTGGAHAPVPRCLLPKLKKHPTTPSVSVVTVGSGIYVVRSSNGPLCTDNKIPVRSV